MAKPPCNFTITQVGPDARGNITVSTNPQFPTCEVSILVNGKPANQHIGEDTGDIHISGVGHDSVSVIQLKKDPHWKVEITVECAICGPTTEIREFGLPPDEKWPLPVAILLAPFTFLIWLGLEIWKGLLDILKRLQDLWGQIKKLLGL